MSYSDINTEKDTTMKNYKLILQYDGTRYSGWQKQGNTDNTIQAKLETIASKLTGVPTDVNGSGRTDAGVHAFGQVANFRCEESTLPPKFLRSEETVTDLIRDYFNNALPMDVRVLSVSEAPARFHARLNAKEKHYRYVIDNAAVPDVFTRRYAARIPVEQEARVSYDIEAMQRAANALIGEHDFKSFCDNRHMKNPLSEASTISGSFCRTTGSPWISTAMDFCIIWFAFWLGRCWRSEAESALPMIFPAFFRHWTAGKQGLPHRHKGYFS